MCKRFFCQTFYSSKHSIINQRNLNKNASWIRPIARIGLAAKGVLYSLLGLLAVMSALHINGQTSNHADRTGVFEFVLKQPAGKFLLALIAAGLLCYSIWRFIQTFLDTERKGQETKGVAKRATYLLSGLTYFFIGVLSVKALLDKPGSGNSQKETASQILEQPAGQWLLVAVALIMAGVGIYQIWYGNSEKYRKHVDVQELDEKASRSLLRAGKIGYIARGIVWLVVAFLFAKAAIHNRASEAGDTSDAFGYLQGKTYGSYILLALALGLICYGVLNFIRAGFEKFKT
jgi:hypothetical protein